MGEKLTIITGPMFSEKTSSLISQVVRAEYAGNNVEVFKPAIDKRYGDEEICTHDKRTHRATVITDPKQILEHVDNTTRLVAIDEVQFMDPSIVDVIMLLLKANIEVVIAGLSRDFRGEPFGSMGKLLCLADETISLTAICTDESAGVRCGAKATRTQRIINGHPASYNDPVILVGAQEAYEARCTHHHIVPDRPALALDFPLPR